MIGTLQGLRIIFILLIFISHIRWNTGVFFDFGGDIGVSFFFILSGFVLSVSYSKKRELSYKHFVIKHIARLYPLHILTLVFALFIDFLQGYFEGGLKILANIVLIQSWIPHLEFNFSLNSVAWFLSDMVFMYLIFPVVYRIVTESSRWAILIASILIIIAYIIFANSISQEASCSLLYVFPVSRFLDFAIGMLVFRLYASQISNKVISFWMKCSYVLKTCLEFGLIILVFFSWIIYLQVDLKFRYACLFWFINPLVIYFFSIADYSGGWFSRILKLKFMGYLGGLTLEIFMLHFLVIRFIVAVFYHLGYQSGDFITILCELVLTFIVSFYVRKFFTSKVSARH